MSSPTWTPDALASEAKPWRGRGWRLVGGTTPRSTLEARRRSLASRRCSKSVEASKPPLPAECRAGLTTCSPHRSATTAPSPHGFTVSSRRSHGWFYAAERPETAVAEMAFTDSRSADARVTPWPGSMPQSTAFAAAIALRTDPRSDDPASIERCPVHNGSGQLRGLPSLGSRPSP